MKSRQDIQFASIFVILAVLTLFFVWGLGLVRFAPPTRSSEPPPESAAALSITH